MEWVLISAAIHRLLRAHRTVSAVVVIWFSCAGMPPVLDRYSRPKFVIGEQYAVHSQILGEVRTVWIRTSTISRCCPGAHLSDCFRPKADILLSTIVGEHYRRASLAGATPMEHLRQSTYNREL